MTEMTVDDLIERLQQVKDKSRKVTLLVNDKIIGDFHVQDNGIANFYLSNYGEESYSTSDWTN